MTEALFYEKGEQSLQCLLCPHFCVLRNDESGICRVRMNRHGMLVAHSYGKISGLQMDPIEKKPLYHFMTGTETLSFGSYGCNLRCSHCQNWHLSMETPKLYEAMPQDIVKTAKRMGAPSISFTYNEPFISYEYVTDTAKMAKYNNLSVILVTNGYVNQEPLKEMLPYIDAMNIDLKAFHNETHLNVCGGQVAPVLNTIQTAVSSCHVEVTTLLVTGMHTKDELREMFQWLADLSPSIPLHLTRYFPAYQSDAPATEIHWIHQMCEEASRVLHHVYPGNC